MRSVDDIERYMSQNGIPHQSLGDGLFVVTDEGSGLHQLAIKVEPPVVVFRLRVLTVPPAGNSHREHLFEQLLRLNGGGMLHAAFCIQNEAVYLTAALPLENLDANELQAVIDDIGLAISQHVPRLDVAKPTGTEA